MVCCCSVFTRVRSSLSEASPCETMALFEISGRALVRYCEAPKLFLAHRFISSTFALNDLYPPSFDTCLHGNETSPIAVLVVRIATARASVVRPDLAPALHSRSYNSSDNAPSILDVRPSRISGAPCGVLLSYASPGGLLAPYYRVDHAISSFFTKPRRPLSEPEFAFHALGLLAPPAGHFPTQGTKASKLRTASSPVVADPLMTRPPSPPTLHS